MPEGDTREALVGETLTRSCGEPRSGYVVSQPVTRVPNHHGQHPTRPAAVGVRSGRRTVPPLRVTAYPGSVRASFRFRRARWAG